MHQCTKVQSKAEQGKVFIRSSALSRDSLEHAAWAKGNPRSLGSDLFMHAHIFHALGSTKQISAHLNISIIESTNSSAVSCFVAYMEAPNKRRPGEEEDETWLSQLATLHYNYWHIIYTSCAIRHNTKKKSKKNIFLHNFEESKNLFIKIPSNHE